MILSKYSVIDNLQTIFHSQFVGVITNYLYTKLHIVHIINIKVLHINCIKKTINCIQTWHNYTNPVSLNHYVTPQLISIYIITSLASLALSVVIISYEACMKWNVGFDFAYFCLFETFLALKEFKQTQIYVRLHVR